LIWPHPTALPFPLPQPPTCSRVLQDILGRGHDGVLLDVTALVLLKDIKPDAERRLTHHLGREWGTPGRQRAGLSGAGPNNAS
jgi:hypothetical protein